MHTHREERDATAVKLTSLQSEVATLTTQLEQVQQEKAKVEEESTSSREQLSKDKETLLAQMKKLQEEATVNKEDIQSKIRLITKVGWGRDRLVVVV